MEWIGGILLRPPPTPTHSLYPHPVSLLNPWEGWGGGGGPVEMILGDGGGRR